MTQAYNLSQLANNLNSSGQLDATDGLVNAVPVANGGTGGSSASAARTNLGVPSTGGTGASGTWAIDISGNSATATNPASGGSFITSSNIGSQSVSYATTAGSAGNGGVTSVNDKTGAVQSIITLGTVNTSSGVTSKAFTGLPSWVNRVTLIFQNIVLTPTTQGEAIVQIGSGSYASSGYYSTGQTVYSGSGSTLTSTTGFEIYSYDIYRMDGTFTLTRLTGNTWACNYMLTYDTSGIMLGAGTVSLGGALDRVRLTTKTGTATYSGSLNMMYE